MTAAQDPATLEQLQRVHAALRIATPLHLASPMLLATLTTIAHCWRGRIPENLWSSPAASRQPSPHAICRPHECTTADAEAQNHIDLKRRAAGDID